MLTHGREFECGRHLVIWETCSQVGTLQGTSRLCLPWRPRRHQPCCASSSLLFPTKPHLCNFSFGGNLKVKSCLWSCLPTASPEVPHRRCSTLTFPNTCSQDRQRPVPRTCFFSSIQNCDPRLALLYQANLTTFYCWSLIFFFITLICKFVQ